MFEAWTLHDFAPGDGERAGAHTLNLTASDGWLPIAVPGDVHRTLVEAGRLDDPFYDQNERQAAWIEEREWWYRTRFTVLAAPSGAATDSPERQRLVFHGLDTFATVYLNGEVLGTTRNMFREHAFDVTDSLQPGENLLCVRFDPPLTRLEGRDTSHWWEPSAPRVAMRKAQFGYGWDWGPRLPTVGLWRAVELRRETVARLEAPGFRTLELSRDHSRALVAVRVQAERFAGSGKLQARVRLSPPDGPTPAHPSVERTVELDGDAPDATVYLELERPELWWTHDLGRPALYTLEVTLLHDDPASGQREVDRLARRVGVRTLVLDQSHDPDEPGTRFFRFVLNGYPVFARGANWIPCNSFVGAIPPERYRMLLEMAHDGSANALRVWGGGIYEHDAFYDLTDELGMLVWQDFMFACAPYPEDDDFATEVALEAEYQVRRLRAHPSLALWCGNNENQWLHDQHFWDPPGKHVPGARYYDQTLPEIVAREDRQTPYWSGSPFGGNDHNSMLEGDRHNWDVWHGNRPFDRHFGERPTRDGTPDGVDIRHYAEDMARFNSEFGLHAAPERVTLETVIPPSERYHHSPAMDHHNKDNPKNKGDNLMFNLTGLPRDLDGYIAYSQIAQAEGLKFAVEHFRRRKPHCSGALVWQLNDCWPVQSWAYIDYHGIPKAAYSALKRAFAPVLVSFKALEDGSVELWVCNDTISRFQDTLTVRHASLEGITVFEEALAVEVEAGLSLPVRRWHPTGLEADPDHYLSVRAGRADVATNRHFFAPLRDLPLCAVPQLEVRPINPHRLELSVTASGYVVGISVNLPSLTARVSDGHFDLEPGEAKVLIIEDLMNTLDPNVIGLRWFAPALQSVTSGSPHRQAK
jgi:beta-mannosidase